MFDNILALVSLKLKKTDSALNALNLFLAAPCGDMNGNVLDWWKNCCAIYGIPIICMAQSYLIVLICPIYSYSCYLC